MGFFSDLEDKAPTPKKNGFFSDIPEEVSRTRSLLSAFPKGLMKGGKQLAQLRDPISGIISSYGKNKPDMEERLVEEFLPTQKGKFAEDVLETAGELTPSFALGPGGLGAKAAQVAAGSLSKSVLKKMGAPELVQDIGAGVGSIVPQGIKGVLSKKLLPSKSQKEVFDLLKGYGFSDKEITPFIQNEKKASRLGGLARAFLDPKKFREETKPLAETVYDAIRDKQELLPPLSGFRKAAFQDQLNKKLEKIHPRYLKLIREDLTRLKNSNFSFKDLREFEDGIKIAVGDAETGKAVLGILKEPIDFGEKLLSKDLFKEKELMHKAYASRAKILDYLPEDKKQSFIEKATGMGPVGSIAATYIMGTPAILKWAAIKKGAELTAAKMLTSPRFQNMQKKLFKSIMDGNKGAVIHILSKMINDTDKLTTQSEIQS